MTTHVFEGDELGDCAHCPLPAKHPSHLPPPAAPHPTPGKRPINVHSREEGEALAATSKASEDFRETFFLAMAEVATDREFFSTNDAWDLLEARGYQRSGSAQATGTVGPSGCSIGLWKRTDQKAINTSGNLHSTDDGVRVYRSLIRGTDYADIVGPVRAKARALREKAEERERAKVATERPVLPPEAVERVEWRLIDEEGITSRLLAAHVPEARRAQAAGSGLSVQRRTTYETPWSNA